MTFGRKRFIIKEVSERKNNMKNKSTNEDGPVFKMAEVILTPLAWAVRFQVAVIHKLLYAAFVMDRIIAKLKLPRIRFK